MENSTYYFYKMPTFRSSKINKAIVEHVKVPEWDYGYMIQFLKKLKLCIHNRFQKQCLILSLFAVELHLYLFIICII